MRLVLAPRLALLPSPASVLTLAAERFGPPAGEQRALLRPGRRGSPRAAARGDPPAAQRRRRRRRAARPLARPRLARARAARDAHPVRVDEPGRAGSPCRAARGCRAAPGGQPLAVDGQRGRARARVLAGRGSLVDRPAAAPPLLGARQRDAAATSSSSTTCSPAAGCVSDDAGAMTYVELHCHSAFSFLDGASLPDELVGGGARARPRGARADRPQRRLRLDGVRPRRPRARPAADPRRRADLDDGRHLTLLVADDARLAQPLPAAHARPRPHPRAPARARPPPAVSLDAGLRRTPRGSSA